MKLSYKSIALFGLAATLLPAVLMSRSHASDHADTPTIAANPGTDITDVFMFPSPKAAGKVVLAMNVHPLIAPGDGTTTYFDPNVLYQFKIDANGDANEDYVIQARFTNPGPNQVIQLRGPSTPEMVGSSNLMVHTPPLVGKINTVINGRDGMKVFAGGREDPFFFDLERFFAIFPDRATPLSGVDVQDPNVPQFTSWRPQGEAVDFLSNGGYNVLSIVVELPKALLRGANSHHHVIGLWTTTSVPNGHYWKQRDRLARPAVNEVFATVANGRHQVNDEATPAQDAFNLKNDILGFMNFPAGRSSQIGNVMAAVLVPDVLKADLDGNGAAYLGYETGGATGGTFGGRALSDDVIDISLGAIFGTTISDLGLAPADNNQIPTLTSDHVGPEGKHFINTFPYLGAPR